MHGRGSLMTSEAFDALVARLDAPLIVVTAGSEDQRAGCVVGFHTQCSIDPVRYAVWLSKANHTYRVSLFAQYLAMHFLDVGDHALADLFGGTTGDDTDKFSQCEWTPGPGGVPLLAQCTSRIVLERTSQWDDGSDHVCIVGEPVEASVAPHFAPLRLADASDITAGHDAEERATPTALDASAGARAGPPTGVMDDQTRERLESAAAGAGHAIDLSPADPPTDS